MRSLTRRQFSTASLLAGSLVGVRSLVAAENQKKTHPPLRVAVIGHTGRGDYGHGLHTMWLGLSDSTIVGVADPDATGLSQSSKLLGGVPSYADYRQLIDEKKPDIVALGMRHVDQHRDIAVRVIEAGVRGIYMEKPFCRTPREADEIIAAAEKHRAKVAVAHRNRYHPVLPVVKELIAENRIGRLLEIRMRGKEDPRGGMLDLWVLGSHLMNLAHYFAGAPRACWGTIYKNRLPVTPSDAAEGAEGIGRMAGDEVHARFEMESGIPVFFDSIAKAGNGEAGFGLQLIGTQGVIDLRVDREPLAQLCEGSPFNPRQSDRRWIPISSAGIGQPEPIPRLEEKASKHFLGGQDLIDAIRENRQPLCHAREAAVTIEMIQAVPTSHFQGGARVTLPLTHRDTPFS